MHKVKTPTAPAVILQNFHKPAHPYPTNFSKLRVRSHERRNELKPL